MVVASMMRSSQKPTPSLRRTRVEMEEAEAATEVRK